MSNDYYHNPLEIVSETGANYKIALLGMVGSEKQDARRQSFRTAAKEYEQALKAAMKYLKKELQRLNEEVSDYDD